YALLDHLGSIAVLTDETGAVVERLSYDAWGKRRFATGADDPAGSIASQITRGFTGLEMIDAAGLINMNRRIQDPAPGRFLSADPVIQDPASSQSLNRYAYVWNNPLSSTDPSGFSANILYCTYLPAGCAQSGHENNCDRACMQAATYGTVITAG